MGRENPICQKNYDTFLKFKTVFLVLLIIVSLSPRQTCYGHFHAKVENSIIPTFWIVSLDPSLQAVITPQISSKVLICDDKVYHRKFRYGLKAAIIDFKKIQKRFIEQLESK